MEQNMYFLVNVRKHKKYKNSKFQQTKISGGLPNALSSVLSTDKSGQCRGLYV